MTECYQTSIGFPPVSRRKVEVDFDGGEVTSDGGVILLRQVDRRIGLVSAINKALVDPRVQGRCTHSQEALLRQRIFGVATGYEDLNDHDVLRHDTAFQTSVECHRPLSSSATLCRLEQRVDRQTAVKLHQVLFDQFVASFAKAPKRLILDFDATDNPVHGDQVGKYYNTYYRNHCFLPLYVFCGHQLLVAYLRGAKRGAAHHAGAVLALLVKHLRKVWPKVEIIFRGDGGYCKPLILDWCDRNGVKYVVGMAKNPRLLGYSEAIRENAVDLYQRQHKKQRLFGEFQYKAHSWGHARRMIVKAEHSGLGANPRFVVTNLSQRPKHIYTKMYCARGDMENRIKEQMCLFSGRTSCHDWWPNQFRLLLSGFAYTLVERLRHQGLRGTQFANAQVDTIRLKLFKIGGVVIRNTRRVKIMLSTAYSHQALFRRIATTLDTG